MIPRPPRPAWPSPALDEAMSGPRLLERLRASGVEMAQAIEAVRPERIELVAGRRAWIRYRLRMRRGTAGGRHRLAHVHLGAPSERSRRASDASSSTEALEIRWPGFGSPLFLFPGDPALPGLSRACDREAVAEGLAGSRVSPEGPPDLRRWRLEDYRPGRRARLRYSLRVPAGAIYARGELLDPVRARHLAGRARVLERIGIPAPRLQARDSGAGLVLLDWLPGRALDDALREGRAIDPAPVLDLLARLVGLEAASLIARLPRDCPAERASRVVHQAGLMLPELRPRFERLAISILDQLAASDRPERPTCLDLRAEQLRVGADGAGVEDLSVLVLARPELAAGDLSADLTLRAAEGEGAAASLRAAWIATWMQGARSAAIERPDCAALAAFESLRLLERVLEPFEALASDWPEVAADRLRLAEACMDEAGTTRRQAAGPAGFASAPSGAAEAGLGLALDSALPQLEVLRSVSAMQPRLRAALAEPALRLLDIRMMRHKPGRRCLLRYDLRTRAGTPVWLAGKSFASTRGPRVYELHRQIHQARAMGPAVQVPRALAYLPDVKLLLLSSLPGGPLESRLLAGDELPARAMAAALAALHGSGLELEREHSLERELSQLRRRVITLAEARTELASTMVPLLDRLERELEPWAARWRRQPVHRDCYHEQFLWGSEGLAALDFDDAAMSDPCLDAGNLLAHLELLALQHPRAATRVGRARAAFEHRLGSSELHYPEPLLVRMEAATLLRLVTIHHAGPDGDRIAKALLAACAHKLGLGTTLMSEVLVR